MTDTPPDPQALEPRSEPAAPLTPLAPAGWFPDPGGTQAWRFWDGTAWTSHVHPYPTAQPPQLLQPLPGRPVTSLLADELSTGNLFVHWFLPAGLLFGLAFAILHATSGSYYQALWNWIFYVWHHPNGVAPPQPSQPASVAIQNLLFLPLLAVLVVGLVWQYRAARTARALGIKASLSPGLGVAGWFIPIVNLWFPYQAVRDTMAPQNRLRKWWLVAWIGQYVITLVGYIVAAVIWRLDALLWIDGITTAIRVIGLYGFAFAIVRAAASDHARMITEAP